LANPQNKLYIVFATVEDVACVDGSVFGQKAVVRTPLTVCLFTQYPFFSLHFKLLSMLLSMIG
jgi:hypothetical protein